MCKFGLIGKMESETFEGVSDRYNGITVDSKDEQCELTNFPNKLSGSLKKWCDEKKRCIWFKVHIEEAGWVPILANEGFDFHHSRDSFVMMYKWLPTDRAANLPPACHTNVGVGGIVLNNKNQILVVTEKYNLDKPHWKLPGGYVERGEDIAVAAAREVKEETGIDSSFISMITLRHTHTAMFGNSDIYFVVLLKADTEEISKSDIEIQACKWMDIEEYLDHSHVLDFNKRIVRQALDLENRKLKLSLQKMTLKIASYSREITCLALEDTN